MCNILFASKDFVGKWKDKQGRKINQTSQNKDGLLYFYWNPYPFSPSIQDLKRSQIKEVTKGIYKICKFYRKDRLYSKGSFVNWLWYLECVFVLELLLLISQQLSRIIRKFQVEGTVCKRCRDVTGRAKIQDIWIKIIGIEVHRVGLCHWDLMPLKDCIGNVI